MQKRMKATTWSKRISMSLREKTAYPVLYMFIITLILSAILILFGTVTRQRVKNNEQIAFERAVLQALPMKLPRRIGPAEVHDLFITDVRKPDKTSAGAFSYSVADSLIAYALPLEGPGFWAPIKVVVGIGVDLKTITGIAFYEQNETPGLGGEIIKADFTEQFAGKKLADSTPYIRFLPPTAALDESSVHAITGATQTSKRLGKFMNEQLKAWLQNMGRK